MKDKITTALITLLLIGYAIATWFFVQLDFSPETCEERGLLNNWLMFYGIVVVSGILIPLAFMIPKRVKTGSWD